jgi:hypothetical protein
MYGDDDRTPLTEEQSQLVPPVRHPPTALGTGTPEPPSRFPQHWRRSRARRRGLLATVAEAAGEYVALLAIGVERLMHAAGVATRRRRDPMSR